MRVESVTTEIRYCLRTLKLKERNNRSSISNLKVARTLYSPGARAAVAGTPNLRSRSLACSASVERG
jgi:hypothetical protein